MDARVCGAAQTKSPYRGGEGLPGRHGFEAAGSAGHDSVSISSKTVWRRFSVFM